MAESRSRSTFASRSPATAAAVLQDADAAATLAKGAADVYDAHLCPRCLADYLKDAYDAMRDRFRLGAVLGVGGEGPRIADGRSRIGGEAPGSEDQQRG